MAAPRILVVDGNVAEIRARQSAALGYDSGAGYARVLKRVMPDLVCDIIRPADAAPALPMGVSLANYDGVTITGSALNIYNGGGAIEQVVVQPREVILGRRAVPDDKAHARAFFCSLVRAWASFLAK